MGNQILSVIVPCYNAERFIEKCVSSITSQTYSDIEIIAIDDGSTDRSGEILDNIASSDSRIKVIHQPNSGSSLTREKGIGLASGEYVTFVDADDWIHPQMYGIMMEGMLKENADIAQCGVCNAYPNNGTMELRHRKTDKISSHYTKYSKTEGVIKILDDREWQSYMGNKIYRKELFDNVTFPVGRFLDEDLSVMHQIFHNAAISVYFDSEFYFYRQGSPTQTKNEKTKAKKFFDRCSARWERYEFVKAHPEYCPMQNKMENIFISVSLQALRFVVKRPELFPKHYYSHLRKQILSIRLKKKDMMPEYFSRKKELEFFLFKKTPALYKVITKLD